MSALEIRAVSKSYGPVRAVQSVDLVVPAGAHTAIVGPSGSGKTTLLRLIAGFEAPDAGSIVMNGATLADSSGAMVPAHKRQIGYLPQDGALFPHLTVAANIAFGLTGPADERARRVAELAEMTALDRAMLARWPHELSGGQQQRVALARALAQRPRLMLLDEPFSALDTGLRAATRKAVTQLLDAAGVTALLVTHDQAEALSFAAQIAVMRGGRLVRAGKPLEVYLQPRDAATASFLGEAVFLPAVCGDGFAECEVLGRIRVDDAQRRGPVRIMLRPEQLVLSDAAEAPNAAGAGNDAGQFGVVTEIDFSGAACVLTVLPARGAAPAPLLVRAPIIGAPAVGTRVRITVAGAAHVLSDGG